MTILITNLEDCLEDMTEDEMQQLSGGISGETDIPYIQADWFLSHASRPRFLTTISSHAWHELLYLSGIKRTRRIVGREREEVF